MWKLTLTSFAAGIALICMGASRASAGDVPAGQKIFTENKCTQCHSIDSLKIAKVKSADDEEVKDENGKKLEPPDLSGIGKDHDAAWFTKWLKKEQEVDGHKHKKKFKGSEDELKTLTEWIVSDLKYNVPKKK